MTIEDNKKFIDEIEYEFNAKVPLRFGVNKRNELIRLIYEICRVRNCTFLEIIKEQGIEEIFKGGKDELFCKLKEAFLKLRYSSLCAGDTLRLMPIKISPGDRECPIWDYRIYPRNIFIEKDVRDLQWTEDFVKDFPEAERVIVKDIKEVLKEYRGKPPVEIYNSRRENIFIVKNKAAFVKICPCTKVAVRCGYWILNIGFGCPIDCTYCYLQQYSNAPGIILPANIEDYYTHIMRFDKKVSGKTRIGTGEFTDSLALDRYSKYSSYLVPFFRNVKNLVLELKTKISEIDNVLKAEPHENVAISWSINTHFVAQKYEKGSAGIKERINSAFLAAKRGYKIGFHFDPIICYDRWEDDYRQVIEEVFSFEKIRQNTVWVSLGTLRYSPSLKQAAERRFADNLMFYEGTFFLDTNGKMRYHGKDRIEMYNKISKWIKASGSKCRIYLCMEPEDIWKEVKFGARGSSD